MVNGNNESVASLSLVAGLTYAVLVIAITLALSFPGFGVALLPQPFLRVAVVGKTTSYDVNSTYTALWVIYVLASHFILYLLIHVKLRLPRPYIAVSVLLYLLNLALILAGLSDEKLVHFVNTYTLGYGGIIPGIGITILIEWLGCKASRYLLRK